MYSQAGDMVQIVTEATTPYDALLAALRTELDQRVITLPVIWGNRNWHPYTVDTLRDAAAFGARRFRDIHVVYVTHSIPDTMQDASAVTGPGYREQHEDVQRTIDEQLAAHFGVSLPSSLAYCSRSGNPRTPWLEPDVNDHLEQLAADGVTTVVIAPIGFISDHMEVAFDLDIEAMETAAEHGITAARAGTVGVHPAFVSGLVDMIVERAARERGETTEPATAGSLPVFADVAPPGSCRMQHEIVTGIPVLAGETD